MIIYTKLFSRLGMAFISQFFLIFCLPAQDLLTLEQAIELTMSQNFQVQIAKMDQQIALNNQDRGVAGMLPTINVGGDLNGSIVNSVQQFLTGDPRRFTWARNTSQTIGVNAAWVVYNGKTRSNTYRLLGINQEISQLNVRNQMEIALNNVMTNYYDIVQRVQTLKVLTQNLNVSSQRAQVAKERYELGAFSRMDWLRAQVDLNNDSAAVINQKQSIWEAKITLNQLLNRAPDLDFAVADSIPLAQDLDYTELKNQTGSRNTNIQTAQKQRLTSELSLQIAKGNRLPVGTLNVGASAFNSRFGAGFLVSNRNVTTNGALSLVLPLYNGSIFRRQIANAHIGIKQAEETIKFTQNQTLASFEIAYRDYERTKALYDLEKYNNQVAQQNLEIALERYKLGSLSTIDFRDVQQIAVAAANRLIGIQFQLKRNEINLLRVSGELIKKVE
ncbi:MAG: TolC family protein [Microscillaceae bacterium]|jgi:outer membrane protein TolC|nr:TolC family protein [Microscillaceae bacterium]